jgi:hypothetical protein
MFFNDEGGVGLWKQLEMQHQTFSYEYVEGAKFLLAHMFKMNVLFQIISSRMSTKDCAN